MADLHHVEEALVARTLAALYPDGTAEPSIIQATCRVYRGWPIAAALNADLAAGQVNVTVYPDSTPGRVTTRYSPTWPTDIAAGTLNLTVADLTVDISGVTAPNQVAGLLVDDRAYVYRIQPGDTPALVAASLAELVRADRLVALSRNRITIPGARSIVARAVVDSAVACEVRRQEKEIRIACWCPSPFTRDMIAAAIDESLSKSTFIDLSDGTQARLSYSATSVFDQSQNALLYRRDLNYVAEYATTVTEQQPRMLLGDLVLNSANYLA
jgi:hypothetical protein